MSIGNAKSARVGIYVFPDGGNAEFNSTIDEIRIIRLVSENNYAIYYNTNVFAKLDPVVFADTLLELLAENIPDTKIDLSIQYPWFSKGPINEECIMNIIQLDDYLYDPVVPNELIFYETSESVESIIYEYGDDPDEDDEDDDPDEDDEDDDPDEDDEDDDNIIGGLEDMLERVKSREKSYRPSRVVKSSKNPKKEFKRHGLIVAGDKSALRKDEKVIKAFLKEFIPGNSSWIKKYRAELLKRWMRMYTIPRKVLKKLEKQNRNKNSKKSSGNKITKENAMNFTRKLLGNDSWNNPNK